MLKYAHFNTALEWHILEPQIISITTNFKLLKMLEGGRNNSLSTLDAEKTRNNRLGLEQQRFRLDMGARYIFNFPEARKMRHQKDCFVSLKPLTLQLPLTFTFFRNTIGGDEPAPGDTRHKMSLLLQFYCSQSFPQKVDLKLLGCTNV